MKDRTHMSAQERAQRSRAIAASMILGAENRLAEAKRLASNWNAFADLIEQGYSVREASAMAFHSDRRTPMV